MHVYNTWGTPDTCAFYGPCGTLDLREPSATSPSEPSRDGFQGFLVLGPSGAASPFGGLCPQYDPRSLVKDQGGTGPRKEALSRIPNKDGVQASAPSP
jgi:hypothetical protein